jgi:hypothetical protein
MVLEVDEEVIARRFQQMLACESELGFDDVAIRNNLGMSLFEQIHASEGSMLRHPRFTNFKSQGGSHFGNRSDSKCSYQKHIPAVPKPSPPE